MSNIVIQNDNYYCNQCTDLCTVMTGKNTEEPVYCPKNETIANWIKTE